MLYKFILPLAFCLAAQASFAQNTHLAKANDPQLQQKRINRTQNVATPTSKSSAMSIAQKYEETAISEWQSQHPDVLFISQKEYNALDAAKKSEIAGKHIIYREKIKWADIEQAQLSK